MYAADKDALLCDLAETYGVFDMRVLPVGTLAALASGLPNDSRIKRKLSGAAAPMEILLLAAAVDRLGLLVWAKTKDGQKNRNRPVSLVEQLTGAGTQKKKEDIAAFDSPEAFMAARAKILEA